MDKFWIRWGDYIKLYKYKLEKQKAYNLAFLMKADGYKTVLITVRKGKNVSDWKTEFKD